jgi:peptidoglycan/LPS O-acetylase OafA/YrhL
MDWTLTKQDSAAFKGIAIMAMLVHHLYYSIPDWIEPYDGALNWLGRLGKVCVCMFLFISGYGLSVSYMKEKKQGLVVAIRFVARRLVSFYMNYWVVFLIFVPITVYGFGRSFSYAYWCGGGSPTILNRFLDLMGIQYPPYNITWWFNRLIIAFYIAFPILFWCIKKSPLPTLLASLLWMFLFKKDIWCNGIHLYQFTFIMGILWHNVTTRHDMWIELGRGSISSKLSLVMERNGWLFSMASVLFLITTVLCWQYPIIPFLTDERMGTFLSIATLLVITSILRKKTFLMKALAFLGIHSANIYMTHTFYNVYWNFTWLHDNAIMRSGVNFVVLLTMSILTSLLIELLKEKTGVNKLANTIKQKLT